MKALIILSIFLSGIFYESYATATPLAIATTTTEAAAEASAIGDKGVNKSSAKRFKTPKRQKVRRGKRTCLKKKGCSSGWAKTHAPKTKRSKCRDKR